MKQCPHVFCVSDFWYPKCGGMERSIDNLCGALVPQHIVHVLTPRTPSSMSIKFPFPVKTFPADDENGFYGEALEWIGSHSGPRVVHVFGFSYYWPDAQATFIEQCAILGNTAVVVKVPTLGDATRYLRTTHEKTTECVACFTALTTDMMQELESCGVSRRRIALLHNGVNTSRFTPANADQQKSARQSLSLPSDRMLVGFCGRFELRKRIDLLTSAINTLPVADRPCLVLAGEPDDTFGTGFQVASLVSDDVRWIGAHRDMQIVYHALDAYVTASTVEGMSNSVLEAMASGLPILASDIPGHRELVRVGVNGFLFQSGSEAMLAEELARACRLRGSERFQSLGHASRDIALTEFDQALIVKQFSRLYRNVI